MAIYGIPAHMRINVRKTIPVFVSMGMDNATYRRQQLKSVVSMDNCRTTNHYGEIPIRTTQAARFPGTNAARFPGTNTAQMNPLYHSMRYY